MANAREIQSRMNSIRSTMKITNAMYTISSSKLKKARKNLTDTEPYFYALQRTISRIVRHTPEIEDPYFDTRPQIKPEDKKIGYIVVTADKGLAGAYNHNVFKLVQEQIDKGGNPMLFVVGELGQQYFVRKGIPVEQDFRYTVQNPNMSRARIIEEKIVDYFLSGKLDEVYMIYTRMVNAMKMEAEITQLLPLPKSNFSVPPGHTDRHPSGGNHDEAIAQGGDRCHRTKLYSRIYLWRSGGILLQRAEFQNDGHAGCHEECAGYAG